MKRAFKETLSAQPRRLWGLLILVAVSLLVYVSVSWVNFVLGEWYRADVANIYKQLGLLLRIYADDDENGYFPRLDTVEGQVCFNPADLAPKYFDTGHLELLMYYQQDSDAALEVRTPDFYYLGYLVRDEEEMKRYLRGVANPGYGSDDFGDDLRVVVDGFAVSVYRMGVKPPPYAGEVDLSKVPILIEKLGHYPTEGGYVVYGDGRVEFLKYPGPWPMTETTMTLLAGMARSFGG